MLNTKEKNNKVETTEDTNKQTTAALLAFRKRFLQNSALIDGLTQQILAIDPNIHTNTKKLSSC